LDSLATKTDSLATKDDLDLIATKTDSLVLAVSSMTMSTRKTTQFWIDACQNAVPAPQVFHANLSSAMDKKEAERIWELLWTEMDRVAASSSKHLKKSWMTALREASFGDEEVVQAIMTFVHTFVLGQLPEVKRCLVPSGRRVGAGARPTVFLISFFFFYGIFLTG
jgi:hypothetical protein